MSGNYANPLFKSACYFVLCMQLGRQFASAESIIIELQASPQQAIVIESARSPFTANIEGLPDLSLYSFNNYLQQLVVYKPEQMIRHSLLVIDSLQKQPLTKADFTVRIVDVTEEDQPAYQLLAALSELPDLARQTDDTAQLISQTLLNEALSSASECTLTTLLASLYIDSQQFEKGLTIIENWLQKDGVAAHCPLLYALAAETVFNLSRYAEANQYIVDLIPMDFEFAIKATQAQDTWAEWSANYPQLNFEIPSNNLQSALPPAITAFYPKLLIQLGFSNVLAGYMRSNSNLMEVGKYSLDHAYSEIQRREQTELLPDLYNGMATYWSLKNDNHASARFLTMAIEAKKLLGLELETGDFLNNLGLTYMRIGRLADAQQTLFQAIQLAKHSDTFFSEAILSANLAKTYRMVGDTATARRYYTTSLNISEQGIKDRDTVNTRLALARVELMERNYDKALEQLTTAQEIAEILRPEKLALIYAMFAETYNYKNMTQDAEIMIQDAIQHLDLLLKDSDKANVWVSLATAQTELKQLSTAIQSINQASRLLAANHPTQVELNILEYRARLLSSANESDKLADIFDKTRQLIFEIESSLDFDRMGPNWLSHVRLLYNLHIKQLLNRANTDVLSEVLALVDEYQSKVFERKRFYYANQKYAVPPETEQLWLDKLQGEMAVVNATTAAIKDQQIAVLDKLNERWEQVHSTTNTLAYSDINKSQSINSMQEELTPQSAILRYIALESSCHVVVITKSLSHLDEVQCPPETLTKKTLSGAEFSRQYRQVKATSFIPEWLLQQDSINKLIIVPDAKFQIVPFPLLLLENNVFQYLGTRYELIQTISLNTHFNKTQPKAQTHFTTAAIFDSPVFSPPSVTTDKSILLNSWSISLKELPWSKVEGDAITQIFSGKNILRKSAEQANIEALMSQPFRQAQILHIATHSYYDPQQTDIVGLATAFKITSTGHESGFVSQNYLLSKAFQNQLVVLSGCETALGQYFENDGFLSLANGVLSAGAGSTISTLWKVADQPTAIFMQQFYQALHTTGNSSQALLSARRALASNPRYRYPEYWAAFNLKLAHHQAENFRF